MHCAADTMRSAADMMAQWVRPPYMEKNKLILNEYLGIFMHFESIFFFLIWKMEIFRPTHPLNLENSRFFFKPSLKNMSVSSKLMKLWLEEGRKPSL